MRIFRARPSIAVHVARLQDELSERKHLVSQLTALQQQRVQLQQQQQQQQTRLVQIETQLGELTQMSIGLTKTMFTSSSASEAPRRAVKAVPARSALARGPD